MVFSSSDRTPVGIAVAAGAGAVVLAAVVAGALPVGDGPARLLVVAFAVAAVAAVTTDPVAAAVTAVLAWLVVDGFLVDRSGVLAWHGTADLYRTGVLAGAGVAGLAVGAARRWLVHRRDHRAWLAECRELLAAPRLAVPRGDWEFEKEESRDA